MERTKLLTFSVIGLLLLNLLTIGYVVFKSGHFSQSDQSRSQPLGREGPARVIISRLHFDEQQQKQFLEMGRQHHQETRRLNEESVRLFRTYYSLLATTPPDTAKASMLARQIADIQRQIAELNFAHFQEIKALCRPEQQADFVQLVDDLARLFGRPQRPPRNGNDGPPEATMGGPPEEHPDGPPENFPPKP
ncbi:periplasmic heavy metal sensor [Spirosoma sp. HMF3257]|uniref:Periplasmic heavy metal sensor n=1 Tax=Spirosoma telluris TaxID=2183553 RepID=A0A327NLZ5_9BACT|nr:periplasmic heavy metal sensor [Spirosoma telluris]RAI76451.1 hypothetical protein HMF3257_23955 [Spirosoma telluris]